MSDRGADLRLRAFVSAVFVLAFASLTLTLRYRPPVWSPVLLAFVLVAILAGSLTVQLPSVQVSITSAVSIAAILLMGPGAGAIASAPSALPALLRPGKQKGLRAIFNASQFALADLVGGWLYLAAGGRVLGRIPLSSSEVPRTIIALLLLAAAKFFVNTILVVTVVTLSSGVPFAAIWKSSFQWAIPTQTALALLALALAQVVASEEVFGLVLFVVPLLIARQFYQRYAALRQAYADMVRSLVAVIEAKDAYTRGHSERVAVYSVEIARRLGLPEARVSRIELAALLHDLGKVGISKSILSKNTRLSDIEFEVIKGHPEIGARIIASVPYLADLAPHILSHHERVDGTGYGQHLTREQISLEARILSVADSFDAMTSSRPYRAAMSREATVQELWRCAGKQFDELVVKAFSDALDSGLFAERGSLLEAVDEAG